MFFKGTEKRPGHLISYDVESFGGDINAFTSFDYTCYYINSPSPYINESTNILLDMVSNPLFEKKEIIPERNVVLEEFKRSIDSSNQYNFFKIQENSFPTGYSHSILGNEKTILHFTRKQLTDFRNKYYNSSNALLIISGDLSSKEKIKQSIKKYSLPNGKKSSFPKFKIKNKQSISVHNKDVESVSLNITIQAPSIINKNSVAEDLAICCLGHNESSPLYKNLVLKNTIANYANASTMFMNNGGAHFISIQLPFKNLSLVFKSFEKSSHL